MFAAGTFGASTFGSGHFGIDPYRIRASRTKEGQERLREYYEALGRFVDMFSRTEAAVTLTLWHYAKTSIEVSKIVFAGTRVELGSTFIKQLAEATKAPQELRNDLEDVLQQLGIINGARNHILHYGADTESVAAGKAVVTDAPKAKGEPTTFPISPTLLNQMTSDLHKIIAHLDQTHLGKRTHTLLGDPRHDTWQYKHPSRPKSHSKKVRDRRR